MHISKFEIVCRYFYYFLCVSASRYFFGGLCLPGFLEPIEPKDNDLQLIRVSLEYFMKQVDDNCYKRKKMLGETMCRPDLSLSLLPQPLLGLATPYFFSGFQTFQLGLRVRKCAVACGSTGSIFCSSANACGPDMSSRWRL